jgi:hypothetical protein
VEGDGHRESTPPKGAGLEKDVLAEHALAIRTLLTDAPQAHVSRRVLSKEKTKVRIDGGAIDDWSLAHRQIKRMKMGVFEPT